MQRIKLRYSLSIIFLFSQDQLWASASYSTTVKKRILARDAEFVQDKTTMYSHELEQKLIQMKEFNRNILDLIRDFSEYDELIQFHVDQFKEMTRNYYCVCSGISEDMYRRPCDSQTRYNPAAILNELHIELQSNYQKLKDLYFRKKRGQVGEQSNGSSSSSTSPFYPSPTVL